MTLLPSKPESGFGELDAAQKAHDIEKQELAAIKRRQCMLESRQDHIESRVRSLEDRVNATMGRDCPVDSGPRVRGADGPSA